MVKNVKHIEKKLMISLSILFWSITIITTLIHYLSPWIFGVPNIAIPYLTSSPHWEEMIITDIGNAFMASFALIHCYKKYGIGKTALFFYGSMIFAGLEENEWIIIAGRLLNEKTYFFTRGGLWFFEIPIYTCLGWFFVAYCCYEIFQVLGSSWKPGFRALFTGLLAVCLDFFADPVLTNIGKVAIPPVPDGMWVWENQNTLRLFSIPIMNFIGWVLLIGLFTFLIESVFTHIDTEKWTWKQAILRFFLAFPIMWVFCYFSLYNLDKLFQVFWSNVNIFPITFTS